MDIRGKTALVTGGSRGIGRAIVLALANQGANVAVNFVQNSRAAEEVARQAERAGVKALPVQADVSVRQEVAGMIRWVKDTFGQIDVLVNCAGILVSKGLLDTTEEEWERINAINLRGMFNCCQAAVPVMRAQRRGKIVNISSIAGMRGNIHPSYAITKAGALALTMSLAQEFAQYGICVNAVAPGLIDTELNSGDPAGFLKSIKESVPLQRLGSPDEVAHAVVFLVENDYVTGETINISGGRYMSI